jgi:hypothetical protein
MKPAKDHPWRREFKFCPLSKDERDYINVRRDTVADIRKKKHYKYLGHIKFGR